MLTPRRLSILILTALLVLLTRAVPALAETLVADTVWQGRVEVKDDILIPSGVTLTVKPGTVVVFSPAESSKIDPEYLSHQTELLVRGVLRIEASPGHPAIFQVKSVPGGDETRRRWAGILVDGGRVEATAATVSGAETGLYLLSGTAVISHCSFTGNHYGVIACGPEAELTLKKTRVSGNDYGLCGFNEPKLREEATEVSGNRKQDRLRSQAETARLAAGQELAAPPEPALTHAYGNDTLMGTTVWRGRVRIDGQVRIPPEGRLVIMPGTVVEFSKRDTNGDGIGENGLMIQGGLIAKGTREQPIHFRSAEKKPGFGDWDAINLLGSDQQRNLVEFCQVEDAYRGLHFHFSLVAVTNSVLRHNYRGMQFQESQVELRDNQFYNNKSGLQCRDSDVVMLRNQIFDNLNGANLFRLNLTARDNTIANNRWDGLRIREGAATVEGNLLVGNRFGLQVANAVFGRFNRNLMAGNLETGLALRNTDNVETSGNAIMANGINGIIVREARGKITGNLIADNGERGLGIRSFVGTVSNNDIEGNRLYAIGLDGPGDVNAAGNWWGGADLKQAIFDRHDDPALGTVSYEPVAATPRPFVWPVSQVPVPLRWAGQITVAAPLTVPQGGVLTVSPGTVVKLAPKAGIHVLGRIEAPGEPQRRITFTALEPKGAGSWGEIQMEKATGSWFANCDFSQASWPLHSHFVNLKVNRCLFEDNKGGLRLNSGPVEVSQSIFRHNGIGIRSFRGLATIHDNEFTGNEIAIFIREQGSGMVVNHNNFLDNSMYALRLGDFNDEDVDARDNWWGGKPVLDQVFDGHRESYIGKVIFEPESKQPIRLNWQPEGRKRP